MKDNGGMPPKEVEKFVKQAAGGWSTWEDAQKQAVITKASIQPLVKMHGQATKSEIQSYEDRVMAYAKSVDKLPIWKFETGVKKATEGLEDAVRRYREEVRVCSLSGSGWLHGCCSAHVCCVCCACCDRLCSCVRRSA